MDLNNVFFLTNTDGATEGTTTGSNVTVTGAKGGAVVSENGVEVPVTEPTTVDAKSTDVQSNTESTVAVQSETPAPKESKGLFGGSLMQIALMYVVIGLVFYFIVFRPQKKRQNEAKELIESLQVGDEVVTTSGYYGKITDIGTEVCVVEFGTNKGVRIPVKKSEILRKEAPKFE